MPVYAGHAIQHTGLSTSITHATQGFGQITLTGLFPLVLSTETYSSVHLIPHSEHIENIKPN